MAQEQWPTLDFGHDVRNANGAAMKSAKHLLGAMILLTGLACGDGSTNSLVVVTVVAAPNMAPVAQLRVLITNLSDAAVAKTDTQLFPENPRLPLSHSTRALPCRSRRAVPASWI